MLTLIGRPKAGGGEYNLPHASGGRTAEPSPLLAHLAGEFAGDIAFVWPAPHAPFVLAEAPRRHLVCLSLALAAAEPLRPGPAFVAEALDGSLKRAVAGLVPEPPKGLVRALGRLGETAWRAADYRLLVTLLADPGASKVLRHATAITARDVRSLGALPSDLASAGGILLRLTDDQARLAAACYAGLVSRDGPDRARETGRRWAAARSPKSLFEQIGEDISTEASTPFHPGTARLRPIATRKALKDASRRYRNCLDGRELGPDVHYYEWAGPPGVIVQVNSDPLWGWTLVEGRLSGNEIVPAEARDAIAAELRGMGVHVGHGRWNLHWSLKSAAEKGFVFEDETRQVAEAFGD